ncbi:glycosyl transferase [Enemella evansiae]|uniref:glycosyltransferase n=1 Tax=Enemella evansiae TaxID=2016499 RepID=UPI000B96E9CE|nr:glycosyltransferase [Enemella evansiae]OYO15494.1 glycosyl transferase [Enemella evansiae]
MTTECLSVLVCALPGRGHVAPTAAVVEGLVNHGHRVRVVTGRKYAERFTRLGAEVVLMPAEADFDDADLDASFPGRNKLRGLALARHDLRESFVRPIPTRWKTMQQTMAAESADVVMCDPLFMAGIPLLLTRTDHQPRVYVLGFVPLPLPPLAAPGRGHRAREWAMDRLMGMMTGPVQALAEKITLELSGKPLPCRFINWIEMSDGIFQMTCPSFEYPRPDGTVPTHYIGTVATSTTTTYPLPHWWAELDTERPVIHVTQGTVANDSLGDLIRPTIEALADEDVLVVVTTCGTPLDMRVPDNVRVADFLPYDQLLPTCSLMITNGGYGGVNLALRHGVPLLVVGASEDKRLIAQRVAWSGAGIGIARQRISPRRLRRAARRVLDHPQYRARAQALADEMAATHGIAEILDVVENGA